MANHHSAGSAAEVDPLWSAAAEPLTAGTSALRSRSGMRRTGPHSPRAAARIAITPLLSVARERASSPSGSGLQRIEASTLATVL